MPHKQQGLCYILAIDGMQFWQGASDYIAGKKKRVVKTTPWKGGPVIETNEQWIKFRHDSLLRPRDSETR